MLGLARTSVLALLCATAIGSGLTAAFAAETLDTSKLPRLPNGKDVFASEFQTIFTTTDPVAQAGEAITRALAAQGWQPYIQPFTSNPTYAHMQTLSFKKGALALSVYISLAPAMGNATSIQYATLPLANNLPFPKDATDIAFDPGRPHLNFITGMSAQDALEFFRKELGAEGWSPWSIKDEARTDSAGTLHAQGGVAYYVRDGKNPMLLSLTTLDGKLKGELKAIPMSVLQAISRKDKEPPKVAAAPAPTEMPRNPLAEEIERKVMGDIRDQLAGIRKELDAATSARPGAARQAQAVPAAVPAAAGATLHPLPGDRAPIPLPADLDNMQFDGEDGRLEFKSPSSVRAIAAFYRAQMKPLGWREASSVINRDNMAVLNFTKGTKTVALTIMQMGPQATVRASGSGLITGTPARDPETKTAAAPAKPIQELEAEEVAGLPAPKTSSSKGSEKTPFRLVVNAQVTADLPSVLAFYRRELGRRDWKEDAAKAVVKSDMASLAYTSPDGPATLKLTRQRDDTVITLSLRKPAEAQKAGVLPKAGQSKVLFGNMMPSDATVTINKKTVKVGAGVGSKGPDGPTLDLPPGKYKFSFKVGSAPADSDEVEIAADETWGILIGPGGALALHAY